MTVVAIYYLLVCCLLSSCTIADRIPTIVFYFKRSNPSFPPPCYTTRYPRA